MKNNQAGQSTIEFLFSFVFAVSLILLVCNTSMNYTSGYVAHYATFMASRVLLTQDANVSGLWGPGPRNAAADAAKKTFNDFKLDVFGIQTQLEVNDSDPSVDAGEYLMVGAYARFDRKMDIIGRVTGQAKLELISESFLGREPTRGVCASRICKAIADRDECNETMDITLYDDGC